MILPPRDMGASRRMSNSSAISTDAMPSRRRQAASGKMTRAELARAVAARTGLSVADARRAVDAIFDAIAGSLAEGNAVGLAGFGRFSVSHRAARQGRNPATGATLSIRASKAPKFSPGSRLSSRVRESSKRSYRDHGVETSPHEPPSPPPRDRKSEPERAPKERRLTRTPHLDLSGREPLALGQEFEVVVFADTEKPRRGETSRPIAIRTPPGVREVKLSVWLSLSKHFELVDEQRIRPFVIVANKAQSEEVRFTVRTRHRQPADGPPPAITAFFAYKGRGCGSVSRAIRVQSAVGAPRRSRAKLTAGVLDASTTVRAVDLRVHITKAGPRVKEGRSPTSGDETLYTCTVFSPLLEEYKDGVCGDWKLDGSTAEIMNDYMRLFAEEGATAAQRTKRLSGVGMRLFRLSPKVFREAFWKLLEAGKPLRTIAIESVEPHIPWELMIPNPAQDRYDPLGVTYMIGRWTDPGHVAPAQSIRLNGGWVVVPSYKGRPKLPHAAEEAELVCKLLHGHAIKPPTWTALDEAFRAGGTPLLHFICHGEVGGVGIALAAEKGKAVDGSLRPIDLEDWESAENAMDACNTLVFLNACEVGRSRPSLLGIDGLAAGFAHLGATAVVAPIWSVEDSEAQSVAEEFYKAATSRRPPPLAAILQGIRSKTYDGSCSDSHASYCFFGDPRTVVELTL
jgi:nucleoid DNA-binding protein